MPIIIILGILFIWLIFDVYEAATKSNHVFTPEEMEHMNKEMCGKSQSECAKILRRYR